MVTVINPTSEKSIQKLWATYHTINIIAACTAVPLWFFSPFLTRDIDSNGVHKFFRIGWFVILWYRHAFTCGHSFLPHSEYHGLFFYRVTACLARQDAAHMPLCTQVMSINAAAVHHAMHWPFWNMACSIVQLDVPMRPMPEQTVTSSGKLPSRR